MTDQLTTAEKAASDCIFGMSLSHVTDELVVRGIHVPESASLSDRRLDLWSAVKTGDVAEFCEAQEVGPELHEYRIRYAVTTRMFTEETVQAANIEDAKIYARRFDPEQFTFNLDEPPNVEGDECAFIERDDRPDDDEVEVHIRKAGEPYAWDAAALVKELAGLEDGAESLGYGYWNKVIERAKTMCADPAHD